MLHFSDCLELINILQLREIMNVIENPLHSQNTNIFGNRNQIDIRNSIHLLMKQRPNLISYYSKYFESIEDYFNFQYHQLIDRQIIIIYKPKLIIIKYGFSLLSKSQKVSRIKSIRNYLQYCYLIKSLNVMTNLTGHTFQFSPYQNIHLVRKIPYQQILQSRYPKEYYLGSILSFMSELFSRHENTIKQMIISQYNYAAGRVKQRYSQLKQSPFKLKNIFEQLRMERTKSTKIQNNILEELKQEKTKLKTNRTFLYLQKSKEQIQNAFTFVKSSLLLNEQVVQLQLLDPHYFLEKVIFQQKPIKIEDAKVQGDDQTINLKAIASAIHRFVLRQKQSVQMQQPGAHSQLQVYNCIYTLHTTLNPKEEEQVDQSEQKNKQRYTQKLVKKNPKDFKQKSPASSSFQNQYRVIKFLRNQQCPYICKYYLYSMQKKSIYLEHHKLSFKKFIIQMKRPQNQKKYSITMKLELMKGIAYAVYFLQYNKILHRDLKPSNILLDNNFLPKLIDFGSSCSQYQAQVVQVEEDRLLSTEGYYYQYEKCAPEIQKLYDIWMYEKHILFDSYSLGVMIEKLFELNKNVDNSAEKGQVINQYLKYIRDRCKDPNPDDRLSGEQIVAILTLLLNYQKQQRMSPQR